MVTGAEAYVAYDFETSFGTGGTPNKAFGLGTSLTTHEKRNALNRIYGLGSRNAQVLNEGQYEGGFTVECDLTAQAWWLRALYGSISAAVGADPYVYTVSEANNPPSMVIKYAVDTSPTAIQELRGCVITDVTIVAETGEVPAHATINGLYATESWASSSYGSPPAHAEEVFNMGLCDWSLGGVVERAEISIVNGAVLGYGLGSRNAVYPVFGQREYTATITALFEDPNDYLDTFLDVDNIASMTLTMDNGLLTTAKKAVEITLTNGKINTYGLPAVDPDTPIVETVEIFARGGSAVLENQIATVP